MKQKIWISTAAAVLALAAAGAHLAGARQAPPVKAAAGQPLRQPGQIVYAPDAPQLLSLKISAVGAAPLPVSEPLNGRVAYNEDLTARISSPIAGRVTALRAGAGDTVRAGAVLAEIDAPELAAADADWRKAQADAQRKRMAAERALELYRAEVIALKDLEAAKADNEQAGAELARAALRMKNLHASGHEAGSYGLRSPIGGVVAERQANPGQEVRPDLAAPLFVVSDLRHVWIIADVPEHSAGALRVGQAVTVESEAAPGQSFEARVDHIAPVLDPLTRRIQVRCALFDPDRRLKPEMFVRVSLLASTGAKRAIVVPNASLFADGANDFVFVETTPGTFMRRRVGVALRGREVSYLDSGVASGERVVTEGAFLLNAEVAANAQ